MGVIFTYINSSQERPRVLMDCSANWGKYFVRFTNFVSIEYGKSSVFLHEGEVISDFIYVDIEKMRDLFEATCKNPDRLLVGWAAYAAGMLEIESQEPCGQEWKNAFSQFRPIHRGVDSADIPTKNN